MAKFPITEAEVVSLAEVMQGGLTDNAAVYLVPTGVTVAI